MTRYLFKITSIAFYCLLAAFLCSINQASKDNIPQDKITIFERMPKPIRNLIIHQYLTLKEAIVLRLISNFFANFTPAISNEDGNYFKLFWNYSYDQNIGYPFSNYCSKLGPETLNNINNCIVRYLKISKHNPSEKFPIYCNSCAFFVGFALNYDKWIFIFGGRGDFKDKYPVSMMQGPSYQIKMNERAILVFRQTKYQKFWSCFGDPKFGSEMPETELKTVWGTSLLCTKNTFSVFSTTFDKLISWGNFHALDEIPPPNKILENVTQARTNDKSICVLFKNGSVMAWGNPNYGGKIPEHIQPLLQNIQKIICNEKAYVVLSTEGNVFAWGDSHYGGIIPLEIQSQLIDVEDIYLPYEDGNVCYKMFVAHLKDGTRLYWP